MRAHRIAVFITTAVVLFGAPRATRADAAEAAAEEVLDFFDVPEWERDSTFADDLTEDETPQRRRRAQATAAILATADGPEDGPMPAPEEILAPPAVPRTPAWWAQILPRLTLAGTLRESATTRDVRALALADFALGRRPWPGARRYPRLSLDSPGGPGPPRPPPRSILSDDQLTCLDDLRAAAVAQALVEPGRARSYVVRARRAAWLPELRMRVERRFGRDESLDIKPTLDGRLPLGLDTSDDVRYEARVTWDLSRLVFSAEELAAEAQALRMADLRGEIETRANRLFFEHARLLAMEPQNPTTGDAGAADDAAVRRRLRAAQLMADLDAMSGGVLRTSAACRAFLEAARE